MLVEIRDLPHWHQNLHPAKCRDAQQTSKTEVILADPIGKISNGQIIPNNSACGPHTGVGNLGVTSDQDLQVPC